MPLIEKGRQIKMQNTDKIMTFRVFDSKRKLKALSNERLKLSVKLLSTKKSIEELKQMEAKTVYQKIDEILIKRDRQIVLLDIMEELNALTGELKQIEEEWDKEMAAFKQMALNKR